jgi:hypothetical protein
MQDTGDPGSVRADLLERLRALDTEHGAGSLAELAYRRAREALEKALEEARTIRLQAIDDARRTREQESASLHEALLAQRQAAEAEIDALLRQAEIEAERIRSQAHQDADAITEAAETEATQVLASAARTLDEARTLRADAEQRRAETQRLEAGFNATVAQIAERLGVNEKPPQGWFRRITHYADGTPKR